MGLLAEHVTMSGFTERRIRVAVGWASDEQKSTSGIVSFMGLVSDMYKTETASGSRITLDLRAPEAPKTA